MKRRLLDVDDEDVVIKINDPVSSPEDMQDIVGMVLNEPKVGIPLELPSPEELTAEPGGKVAYDLQSRSPRYSMRGVLGRMSRKQFKGMVWETLRHHAEVLGKTFGGAWKPVAARLAYGTRTPLAPQETGVAPEAIGNLSLNNGEVGDGPQRLRHVPVEERDLVLHVAFAELTQSPIICPNYEENGRRLGKRFAVADSEGLVSKMGTVDRRLRAEAKSIIEWTYGSSDTGVSAELSPELRAKATKFLVQYNMTVAQVAGALDVSEDRIGAVYADLPKPAPAPKRRRKKKADSASA